MLVDAGFTPCLGRKKDGCTTGTNTVFARPCDLEYLGHVVSVWSDEYRTTRSVCSCGIEHGPFHDAAAWNAVWVSHVREATGNKAG